MPPRVVITGMGIITSIGNGPGETYQSLKSGRSGVGPITILDTIHKNELMAGEVRHSYEELLALSKGNTELPWTRTALLGLIAARQAMEDARLEIAQGNRTALVSATTVGGMDRSELFYKSFLKDDDPHPFIDTHHAGDHTEKIAAELGIDGLLTTISTACSSSLNSIMFGARLIKNGLADCVIAGGTDALSRFTLNGFNTLMILDREKCRPFDDTRMGLNLGEGAAYLVLEKESSAYRAGRKVYAELTGYANANDAFHQTASSEEGKGPYLSMQWALDRAGLAPGRVDYINVHGTGTDNNDLTEGIALKRLFGNELPPFSSTKAFTGHTLGAAGAVEAIISLLTLEYQVMFPNLNFNEPIAEIGIVPVKELTPAKLNTVMTNSFGFGGNDSSVVFQRYNPEKEDQARADEARISKAVPIKKKVYINGVGAVAPFEIDSDGLVKQDPGEDLPFKQIIKPDFREYINPKLLRRMSKIVKMGLVAAGKAIKDAGDAHSDAIVTGTGMGCQADTEKFLNGMLDNNESMLNPTPFIQSTHNTVGAQAALMSGNNNYNLTYVHRTFSFESALLDSMMLIREGNARQVLTGGIDEITEESWLIKTKIGFYRRTRSGNGSSPDAQEPGATAGEGAAFFALSPEKQDGTYAAILDVETFFKPKDSHQVNKRIADFLERNRLTPADIDLVMMGYNGDRQFDVVYDRVADRLFAQSGIGWFKHLGGEYDSAMAIALWLCAWILKDRSVPGSLLRNKVEVSSPDRILLYNQFRNINHSLILLEKV